MLPALRVLLARVGAAELVDGDIDIPIPHSSAISGASYNPVTGSLQVRFSDGTQHGYTAPPDVVLALVSSPSPGAYFNRVIRGLG